MIIGRPPVAFWMNRFNQGSRVGRGLTHARVDNNLSDLLPTILVSPVELDTLLDFRDRIAH